MGWSCRFCLDRKTNPFLSLLRCLLAWPEHVILTLACFLRAPENFVKVTLVREVDAMLASQIEVFYSLLMSFDTKIKNVNILFTYL